MEHNTLYHHGIKGQKWGVRRFQNKNGILTSTGKKRYDGNNTKMLTDRQKKKLSNKYKKLMIKVASDIHTQSNYVEAYNRAADKMNDGLIEKYNSDYKKKLGKKAKNHNYEEDEKYINGYEKLFNETFDKEYYDITTNSLHKNTNYKKAELLIDKYNMTSFDDLAKQNRSDERDLKKKYGH